MRKSLPNYYKKHRPRFVHAVKFQLEDFNNREMNVGVQQFKLKLGKDFNTWTTWTFICVRIKTESSCNYLEPYFHNVMNLYSASRQTSWVIKKLCV